MSRFLDFCFVLGIGERRGQPPCRGDSGGGDAMNKKHMCRLHKDVLAVTKVEVTTCHVRSDGHPGGHMWLFGLCQPCYDGFIDLMVKTYGSRRSDGHHEFKVKP